MCEALYFNRFEGFPSKDQAFLVHLASDLAPASPTLATTATRTTAIAAGCPTARAATPKAAAGRTTATRAAAGRTWATDQARFEGFLAILFTLTLNCVAVCTDVGHRGLHGVRLRGAFGQLATPASFGAHQTFGAAVALFGRARCGRTRTNAVATATAAGAFGAVVV